MIIFQQNYLALQCWFAKQFIALERSPVGLPVYKNAFDLMPIENDFSPAPITPSPKINGPMAAIITTTTTDEQIDVDDTFRPFIRYKWDKDNTGIRVRLAQGWAGANHGMQILPRVGDEVLVQFLDGNIDRPVVVSLYIHSLEGVSILIQPKQTKFQKLQERKDNFDMLAVFTMVVATNMLMYDQEG